MHFAADDAAEHALQVVVGLKARQQAEPRFERHQRGVRRASAQPGDNRLPDAVEAHAYQDFSSTLYFLISGICSAPKTKVSGSAPNNLKLTQKSVVCVRQTTSFNTARKKKNSAQRSVSLRQPLSVRWNIDSKTTPSSDLPNISPTASVPPNRT